MLAHSCHLILCPAWQAGLRTHTYPEVLFRATNISAGGSSCNPDAAPTSRHISFGSASNILGDPEEARPPSAMPITMPTLLIIRRCRAACGQQSDGDPNVLGMVDRGGDVL